MIGIRETITPKWCYSVLPAINDERGVFRKLERVFYSSKVDVYSSKKGIKVSHWPVSFKKRNTLESLYLKPLQSIFEKNKGTVFADDSTQLVLMIDLKSNKKKLISQLRDLFEKYEHLIRVKSGKSIVPGPLLILLSGNPPLSNILNDKSGYFSIDGQGDVWRSNYPSSMIPRASMNFKNYFRWKGKKDVPNADQQKLNDLVDEAHANNRKIRFWATKDRPKVWTTLLQSNVDWIGVDDLEAFHHFYLENLDRFNLSPN